MNYKDFNIDLEYSLEEQDNEIFDNFYHRVFPKLQNIVFVKSKELQLKGYDKILTFENGKEIFIDEKKRRNDWKDILLEIWSNYEAKKKGWFITSEADYIVYAFMQSKKVYLLPLLIMRVWAKKHWNYFCMFSTISSKNKYYTTISKAIPTEILLEGIKQELMQTL